MTETVLVDGRIRRVISRKSHHEGALVEVVVGFRIKQSASAKSPGSGWRAVPGQARQWTKSEPRVVELVVKPTEIVSGEDWPSGAKTHGFSTDDYTEIIKPMVAVAVEAAGAIGLRQVPDLTISTCERQIKDAGLAMPTFEEFDNFVELIWRDAYQQKPRTQAPASITGKKKPREPQSTPSVDEPVIVAPETPPE